LKEAQFYTAYKLIAACWKHSFEPTDQNIHSLLPEEIDEYLGQALKWQAKFDFTQMS
jgi:hypothetical protein